MKISSSRLLPFLEPITVELSVKQTERLAQLLEAYWDARQLRVSALAQGAQSLSHFSQGGYSAKVDMRRVTKQCSDSWGGSKVKRCVKRYGVCCRVQP